MKRLTILHILVGYRRLSEGGAVHILLINANLIGVPRVAPYALDILGSALTDDGHTVAVCDLAHAPSGEDWQAKIDTYLVASSTPPDAVAISLRNTSDLILPSLEDLPTFGSFVQQHSQVIDHVKQRIDARKIILGGSGFSSNPEVLLQHFGVTHGVRGPGETAFKTVLKRMQNPLMQTEFGLVDGRNDAPYGNVRRSFVDNAWYYQVGGLSAVRTSNGCGMRCSYCVEPFAKGPRFAKRAVADVLREIDELVALGVRDIHGADSEFIFPVPHAQAVLQSIGDRFDAGDYPSDLRFWLYGQPGPFFDNALGTLLERAHVAGINFGADHTDPKILASLGKHWYTRKDIAKTTAVCNAHGVAVMHVLLFGSPGDTPDKMKHAIDEVWQMQPRVIGAAIGMAVLQGTKLAEAFIAGGSKAENGYRMPPNGIPFLDPVFYVDPSFRIPEIYDELRQHVGERITNIMVTASRTRSGESGQIVGSERVAKQVARGIRGAYWYHYPDLMRST